MNKTPLGPKVIVTLVLTYLFLPFVISALYSFATKWSVTVLPEGYTLKYYAEMFADQRFWWAILRSGGISMAGVALAVLVMTPLTYAVMAFAPTFVGVLKALTLLPYAIPGVISATALLGTYGGHGFPMVVVLGGAYFVFIMPLMYSGISNAMRAIDIVPVSEAARVLGASTTQIFLKIIVPGVALGILVSTLLSFSLLFGEFVVANMLIGGSFETVQIYLYQIMKQTGHLSSALVLIYVLIMTLICGAVIKLSGGKQTLKHTERRKAHETVH